MEAGEQSLILRINTSAIPFSLSILGMENGTLNEYRGPSDEDTRTHVVTEIFETEKSYVESLHVLVNKYMKALKSSDYCGIVDGGIVDEIFFQIPEILSIHEEFLDVFTQRYNTWDVLSTVGDLFVETFTKQQVIDTYTSFINNWKCAKEATKVTTLAKPAFARFLEHMSREHKGKLALDALLIMPVQRIPRYELLLKELLKHTNMEHSDYNLLVQAQKEVHELALKINRVEREAFQQEIIQQKVREIEQYIEGVIDLVQPDREFIRHDTVTIPGSLGTKKERCLFLFSDLMLITTIKKKTIRKPSTAALSSSQNANVLEMNKYKYLTRFPLDSMDISKSTNINLRRTLKDIKNLEEDIIVLKEISDLISKLNTPHQVLEDVVKDLSNGISKHLLEKQNNDLPLVCLELAVTSAERAENLVIHFPSAERKALWEATFNEAKQKLAASTGRRFPPEFLIPLPIRKTRAGLQFTCASATPLGINQQGLRDVWVCNSDGYVGQVCVLSLLPEPTVMSCNGICNTRILTISSAPALMVADKNRWRPENMTGVSIEVEEVEGGCIEVDINTRNIQLDSDSSEEDDDIEIDVSEKKSDEKADSFSREEDNNQEDDNNQPTMWLGTQDGCILVYNSYDNIRTKKHKYKFQLASAIQCIIYMDNKVFVSVIDGEIYIYKRELGAGWYPNEPAVINVGNKNSTVSKMLAVTGKLWCSCENMVYILNTTSIQEEHSFAVCNDATRFISCMVTSGLGVWLTLHHSAIIRLYHATSYSPLLDVNVSPVVSKTLSETDDIIKQHKSACLRVTAMLASKDILWVGTSAGVILTFPLPHLTSSTTIVEDSPTVSGLSHGHTGHVRFLTCVEMTPGYVLEQVSFQKYVFRLVKSKSRRASTNNACKLLVISGGDGYENFHQSGGIGEAAGRDDSTNHLLLWQV
ncbi:rho guanine nucleotide exchange factor 17 isoform X3 [Parasteatoda tepidariorum]|uniref:rho guanine nucleotide exchange factor 17 isoform X3 n=1 Tax=Parasteatoda tepidariorum TaxID=114398 RepID=UPI0039BCC97B